MSDSNLSYWNNYISKLSPYSLIALLSLVNKLLDCEDIVESESFDFFDQLFNFFLDEISFRYHAIVYDCLSSGTLSLDFSSMVSEVSAD